MVRCAVDDAKRDNTSFSPTNRTPEAAVDRVDFRVPGPNVLATKAKIRNTGTFSCRCHRGEPRLAVKGGLGGGQGWAIDGRRLELISLEP